MSISLFWKGSTIGTGYLTIEVHLKDYP